MESVLLERLWEWEEKAKLPSAHGQKRPVTKGLSAWDISYQNDPGITIPAEQM